MSLPVNIKTPEEVYLSSKALTRFLFFTSIPGVARTKQQYTCEYASRTCIVVRLSNVFLTSPVKDICSLLMCVLYNSLHGIDIRD